MKEAAFLPLLFMTHRPYSYGTFPYCHSHVRAPYQWHSGIQSWHGPCALRYLVPESYRLPDNPGKYGKQMPFLPADLWRDLLFRFQFLRDEIVSCLIFPLKPPAYSRRAYEVCGFFFRMNLGHNT